MTKPEKTFSEHPLGVRIAAVITVIVIVASVAAIAATIIRGLWKLAAMAWS